MYLKIIFYLGFVFTCFASTAQTTKTTSALLNPKPLFVGGGLVFGAGANSFQLGINPELIKSFNPYVDGGLAMNIYYEMYNASEFNSIKSRNFRLGIGAFTRVWPLDNFFIQIQPEYNFAWINQKDNASGQSGKHRYGAESVLTGIGYGKRNEWGISYFSVMIDILNNPGSPYLSGYQKKEPVYRAGVGFPIKWNSAKKHL